MNTKKGRKSILQKIIEQVDAAELEFDDISFDITSQIHALMQAKGVSQKQLADFLKCSEASVSRQLSGDVNLTLKTIAKYLVALSAKMDIRITNSEIKTSDIYNVNTMNNSIYNMNTMYKWEKKRQAILNLCEVNDVSAVAA